MQQIIRIEKSGPLFENPAAIIQDGLDSFVMEVLSLLESAVKEKTPRGVFGDQGGLAATIHGDPFNLGTPAVMGIVGHQSVYGDVIEMGRRPGKMPPPGVLLRWMEVVLGMSEKEAQRKEYGLRLSIAKKGFDGAFMFQKALEENETKIEDIAQKYGIDIAFNLNGG